MLLASAADPSYGSRLTGVLVALALCGLSARRGYVKALAFERSYGQGPRGWEPVSWSILCFSLLLIGHAMLGSALKRPVTRRTTDAPAPVHDPFSWGPPAAPAAQVQAWEPPPVVAAAPEVVAPLVAPHVVAAPARVETGEPHVAPHVVAPPEPPAAAPPAVPETAAPRPRAVDILPGR